MSSTHPAPAGRVLIVDDAPADLDLLRHTLEQAGFRVLVATSGEQALYIAGRTRPDLVLLDVAMPGLDGYETCERLKAAPETANVPVLFLTAHDGPESLVRAFAAGGADYIAKPFHREEVLARVAARLACARRLGDLLAALEQGGIDGTGGPGAAGGPSPNPNP